MGDNSLKDRTINGVFWSGVKRLAEQGIAFIFNLLIARQLLPSDYGILAMLSIFISLSETFIYSGFANALIRDKNRTEEDFSTVFLFNIGISLICYALLFFGAPAIARFYDQPLLKPITRVIGLNLIIGASYTVHSVKLTIDIDFKAKAKIAFICSTAVGFFSLFLAYKGFGVWTLVIQQVASSAVACILYFFVVKWWPKLRFSIQSFKRLFSYGSKILLTSVISTVYSNISSIVVGKLYKTSDLGEYSKAGSFANLPVSMITGVIINVIFPVLSDIQDDAERLRKYYHKFLSLSTFIIFPIMVGISAVADPLIRIALTDNWRGMVPLLQMMCFATMWLPVNAVNCNLLFVMGRSDLTLKLELIKKGLGLVILAATLPIGIKALCIGQIVFGVLEMFINARYTKMLISFGIWDQVKTFIPILIHSMIMGVIAFALTKVSDNLWVQLLSGSFAGAAYYLVGAKLLHFNELDDLLSIAKEKLGRK